MVGMLSGLLSLMLFGWTTAADRPSQPTCSSAQPNWLEYACVLRLGHRGSPTDRRGRKPRDFLDDDDTDEKPSFGSAHAGASGLVGVPATTPAPVPALLREAA